jgi:hypothetical protein
MKESTMSEKKNAVHMYNYIPQPDGSVRMEINPDHEAFSAVDAYASLQRRAIRQAAMDRAKKEGRNE